MNSNALKGFLREPALLIELVEVGLLMLVAFGLGLSGDQQNYIVAAVVALTGLATAFFTRPFAVAALTDAARALLVVAASFGVGLTADQIALGVTFLGVLTTIVVRAQVTPSYDAVVTPGGSGAGPVSGLSGATSRHRGEHGYTGNSTVLLVLAIVGVVLLVLFAVGVLR